MDFSNSHYVEQASRNSLKDNLDILTSMLKTKVSDCNFILDLDAPNFIPLDGFLKVIQGIISKLPFLNDWKTFTIIGTAFPETMGSIKEKIESVPRYEWKLYKKLINNLKNAGLRLPTFGDYAINHPTIQQMDMRIVKPTATIRYTDDDSWCIVKGIGKNVRDDGFMQYHDLCKKLVESGCFCGASFSYGDEYIQKCANGGLRTGNLTTWRQVGTNHHIVKATVDIANFYASLKTP